MRFSELDGRTIGVWGLGRETRSLLRHVSARLPHARLGVLVLDDPADAGDESLPEAVPVLVPDRARAALARCDVLVRSPGVSIHKPLVRALIDDGLPVTTATSLWLAERGGHRVIGITGTKGKSTTATITAHLAAADRPATLAGNIGLPALDLLDAPANQWVVLELSSYQIADLAQGPAVAVITNLFKEHTDWHGGEAAYRAEKLRLFTLPGVSAAVHPAAVPEVAAAAQAVPRRLTSGDAAGWHLAGDGIEAADGARVGRERIPLRGEHNALNLCAALTALEAAELPRPQLPAALDGIAALPHRLQPVAQRGGVTWVDDSISTTPESTLAALAAFGDAPALVLIAGGLDRGQDYSGLGRVLATVGAGLVTLPDTGERIARAALGAGLPAARHAAAPDMPSAVAAARALAGAGAVVLLSPAAPSYNLYRDFEARGDHFAALVRG